MAEEDMEVEQALAVLFKRGFFESMSAEIEQTQGRQLFLGVGASGWEVKAIQSLRESSAKMMLLRSLANRGEEAQRKIAGLR